MTVGLSRLNLDLPKIMYASLLNLMFGFILASAKCWLVVLILYQRCIITCKCETNTAEIGTKTTTQFKNELSPNLLCTFFMAPLNANEV